MARYEGVSASVIRRLPRYHRFLYDLIQKGVHRISSRELAELMSPVSYTHLVRAGQHIPRRFAD